MTEKSRGQQIDSRRALLIHYLASMIFLFNSSKADLHTSFSLRRCRPSSTEKKSSIFIVSHISLSGLD